MRVKHWQGYGSVNVFKKERKEKGDGLVSLTLQVRGNHEYGIERRDTYDVVRWIGTKCDKKLTDSRQILELLTESYWDELAKEDVCNYFILYEEGGR